MVEYRRNRIAGGTYFFTVTLKNRRARTLVEHIDSLRISLRNAMRKQPFTIDGMVVLPEHLHAVWTLPPGDADFSGRWRVVKAGFSRLLAQAGHISAPNTRCEYGLWQPRFWEHTIRDEKDFVHHIEYIHFNPVKHGLVNCVQDWPYSTFHTYVEKGLLPCDWAGGIKNDDNRQYGEI